MKKFLKVLLIVILAVLLLFAGLIGWLSIVEFKPEPVMDV